MTVAAAEPVTDQERAAVAAGAELLDEHWGLGPDGGLVDRAMLRYGPDHEAGPWMPGRYEPTPATILAVGDEWHQAAEFGDAHDWRRASYRLAGMARMAMQFGRWADGNYLSAAADEAWAKAGGQG